MKPIAPPCYYPCIIRLALPIYRQMIKKKSGKLPTYERELAERFGKAYLPVPTAPKGLIWCHAVSLGELNTAYPLLKILLNQGFALWITSTTQTGFNRAATLFADDNRVAHSFVPVDNAKILNKFLTHICPVMALFIETELWATTLFELNKRQIPSIMVNARLTQKSFHGYQKFAKISQSMMNNLSLIIAQDKQSAEHFVKLGASSDKVKIADSLKWSSSQTMSDANVRLLTEIKSSPDWSLNRPIWVAGSTHAGEEEAAIATHRKLLEYHLDALLILVPRHPERFDDVASLCKDFTMHRQSKGQVITPDTQIYLADSMGELLVWYALADVVFVGGSLVDVGGHNPIEPASLARPIIMGQYVKNCEILVQALSEVSALSQIVDNHELFEKVKAYFDNPNLAQTHGKNGQTLVTQKQNAVQNQLDLILELL